MDFFSLLTQSSEKAFALLIQGGLIMVPLVAASIISLAIIIERWLFWRRLRTSEVSGKILTLVAEEQHDQAIDLAQSLAGMSERKVTYIKPHKGLRERDRKSVV